MSRKRFRLPDFALKVTTWIAKLLAKAVAGSFGQGDLAERR